MSFVVVPMANESAQSTFQLTGGVEHAVSEHAFLNNAEEYLDLVDPGRVNRSVEEAKPITVTPIELVPSLVFAITMNVEIVPDDIDLLSWVPARYGLHEIQDVDGFTPLAYFGVNVARMRIKCGEKSPRSMSDILAVVSATASARSEAQVVFTSQCLHSALFVDA